MVTRPGSSRKASPYWLAALFVRGAEAGAPVCAWCRRRLTPSWKTIDHLDNHPTNNEPWNVVPACPSCNSARASGWESFTAYLQAERQQSPREVEATVRRVEAQRVRALPARDTPEVRALARAWYGERLAELARAGTERSRYSHGISKVLAGVAPSAEEARVLQLRGVLTPTGNVTANGRITLEQVQEQREIREAGLARLAQGEPPTDVEFGALLRAQLVDRAGRLTERGARAVDELVAVPF